MKLEKQCEQDLIEWTNKYISYHVQNLEADEVSVLMPIIQNNMKTIVNNYKGYMAIDRIFNDLTLCQQKEIFFVEVNDD